MYASFSSLSNRHTKEKQLLQDARKQLWIDQQKQDAYAQTEWPGDINNSRTINISKVPITTSSGTQTSSTSTQTQSTSTSTSTAPVFTSIPEPEPMAVEPVYASYNIPAITPEQRMRMRMDSSSSSSSSSSGDSVSSGDSLNSYASAASNTSQATASTIPANRYTSISQKTKAEIKDLYIKHPFLADKEIHPLKKNGKQYSGWYYGDYGELFPTRQNKNKSQISENNINWALTYDKMLKHVNAGSAGPTPFNFVDMDGAGMPRRKLGGRLPASETNYRRVGSKFIHLPSLQKNSLSMRHPNYTNFSKKTTLSPELTEVIKTLVFDDKIDEQAYDKLDIQDKNIYTDLLKATRLQYQLRNSWTDPKQALQAEFDKLRGELALGNDNPLIIKKLKPVVIDLFAQGMLSEKDFRSIISQLI